MAIIIGFSSLIYSPGLLLAQSNDQTNSHAQEVKISFNPPAQLEPPNRGTPKSNKGTGSRGDCLYNSYLPQLQSLAGKNYLKFTTSDRPTIWVYLPYTKNEAPYGEFSLQDGDKELYRTRFQLKTKPGIMGIKLPSTVESLKVGKSYRWYVDINCSNSLSKDDFSTPASLTGMIERVAYSQDFRREIQKTASKPLNQIATYAKHGIWYDALTELAQLRLEQPDNSILKQIWNQLLSDQHVNLEEISSAAFLGNVEVIEP
ncbi:DUF928 domain-containing protein [Pleurocapsa sp. PCC 7319]|uniref:DUF928 domain-containing protein n=1 Tax=Pleurocapsa sp. PCC 7319 TaxID=118161 RepID=UPI00130E2C35|nr:DUF928 domain-containing protein [Pleurocapsa sp. PCC 7319]